MAYDHILVASGAFLSKVVKRTSGNSGSMHTCHYFLSNLLNLIKIEFLYISFSARKIIFNGIKPRS
jgi:hypothetical protein